MPGWGNSDVAAQSAIYAPQQLKVAANAANRNALFGNTTADAFIENATVGQYGVDGTEIEATRFDKENRPAHTGWVLRTEGTGGRAGRVQHEVLVALHVSGDAENTAFQQTAVNVTTQPSNATGNAVNNDVMSFTVAATEFPTSNAGSATFQWQFQNTTPDWEDCSESAPYANVTTDTLSVDANGVVENASVRCVVSLTGADDENSIAVYADLYPDLTWDSHPADASGNSGADDIVDFTAEANAEGETATYLWQVQNGGSWDDLSDAGAYSNTDTDTLSVLANTAADGEVYRNTANVTGTVIVSASNTATLTVTS
jgi:hypothetical protein